ncbi:MAG: hypothetical protein JSW23_01180 [Planctomycetota bacterium]|nr:MAG: hypothetical protein JSW23_01180 [Planctomycetota bacterium]
MKLRYYKMLIFAAIATFVLPMAGCEEQHLSDQKLCRLIADENRNLKKQIQKQIELHAAEIEKQEQSHTEYVDKQKQLYEKQIADQRTVLEKEIKRQNKLLADCLQRKPPDERLAKEIEDLIESARADLELIAELRRENEKLQTQISRLEKQLQELKEGSP